MAMPPKKFVGLHAHSGYSVNDGLGYPEEHIESVIENGMDSWALTDHGHMNGFPHAFIKEQELNAKGVKFKFIPGCEMYYHPDIDEWKESRARHEDEKKLKHSTDNEETAIVAENEEESKNVKKWLDPMNRRHHLVVLPKSKKGLQNLFSLVSWSYKEGFYKFPRIDRKRLKEFGEDLILSSACISGIPAYNVFSEFPNVAFDDLHHTLADDPAVMARLVAKMCNTFDEMIDCVGQENFFPEIQFNKLPLQHLSNRVVIEAAKKCGLKLVSTADSHYPRRELWRDRELYKLLGRMGGKDFVDSSRLPSSIEELKCELYPKNAEQMWDEYQKYGAPLGFYDDEIVAASIENTYDIAHDLIGDVRLDTSMKLPTFLSPKNMSTFDYLVELCREGMIARGLKGKKDYVQRLKHELGIIRDKGFELYFVTMKKIIDVASNVALIGSGRGSGGGSLVNYVLGITQIDPLKYNLIFERFVSPSRKDQADIDCLVSEHKVVLSDNSLKMIGDLEVGDHVLDHEGISRKVLAVQSRFADNNDTILLISGHKTSNCAVCVFTGTSKHRFIMSDGTEKQMGEMRINDVIMPDFIIERIVNVPLIKEDGSKPNLQLTDITVEGSSRFRVISDSFYYRGHDDKMYYGEWNDPNMYVVSHNSDVSDRDAVIDAMKKEFGEDSVVPIANWSTLQLKSIVKDVSKFYGIDYEKVNEITRKLDDEIKPVAIAAGENKSLFQLDFEMCMEHSPAFRAFMDEYPHIAAHVKVLHRQIKTCFDIDAQVLTLDGWKKPNSLKHSDAVAYIGSNGDVLYSKDYDVFLKGKRDVYEIILNNGKRLRLTGDHKVKTLNRGWVETQLLTTDDEIDTCY